MINMEAIIRRMGPQALHELEQVEFDRPALLALQNRNTPGRSAALREWFRNYQVFQGINGQSRDAITAAVLDWADSRDLQRDLTTVDALVAAHAELMEVCSGASGKPRDFTSLASKALWLSYPDSVPIYDSFVERALWVLSKLLSIAPLAEGESEYRKFVHIWKALYRRYQRTVNEIPIGDYPYRVRIFDVILWLIGRPRYGREG